MEKPAVMSFDDLALKISSSYISPGMLLAVTGVSSIGKSTLVQLISKNTSIKASVICADDFLKEQYHGKQCFRNNSSIILSPDMFDWNMLSKSIYSLQSGISIEIPHYSRGFGWNKHITIQPSEVIIVDGLFLDSALCCESISFDLIILLECNDRLVYRLRMKRDNYYRQKGGAFSRTIAESKIEISNCLKAYRLYRHGHDLRIKRFYIGDDLLVKEIDTTAS